MEQANDQSPAISKFSDMLRATIGFSENIWRYYILVSLSYITLSHREYVPDRR